MSDMYQEAARLRDRLEFSESAFSTQFDKTLEQELRAECAEKRLAEAAAEIARLKREIEAMVAKCIGAGPYEKEED